VIFYLSFFNGTPIHCSFRNPWLSTNMILFVEISSRTLRQALFFLRARLTHPHKSTHVLIPTNSFDKGLIHVSMRSGLIHIILT